MNITDIVIYIISYLLGAIPFALVVGKVFFNTDVRQHGSGNPGATNTLRVLGAKAGLSVLLLDIGKGVAAVLLAKYLSSGSLPLQDRMTIAGALAVAGHIFSPFLAFKGGKGVATTTGVICSLHPTLAIWVVATFIAVLYASKYVSLASITSAFVFTILMLFWHSDSLIEIFFAIGITLLIVIKHKENIIRLIRGKENRFTLKKN